MAYGKDYNLADSDEKLQSKLNAAGLINSTLERLWSECSGAMLRGDLSAWNIKLDAIWIILGGDCAPNDEDDKKMSEINNKLYNTGKLKHRTAGFSKFSDNEAVKMAEQYLWLMEKSLFLRRLQNKQGKGTAYASGTDDDFD